MFSLNHKEQSCKGIVKVYEELTEENILHGYEYLGTINTDSLPNTKHCLYCKNV